MIQLHITFLSEKPVLPNCGGIERVTRLLADEFVKNGVNVFFAYTNLPKELSTVIDDNQIYFSQNDENSVDKFRKFLKDSLTTVVINQNLSPSNYPYLEAAKSVGVKIISVLHNRPFPYNGFERKAKSLTSATSWPSKFLKYFGVLFPGVYGIFRNKYDRKNYENIVALSDKFYLLSERFIPRILNYASQLPKNKIDAINNPNTFNLSGNEYSKEKLIIWVGRLSDPQKNGIDFMRMWKKFHKIHPEWNAIMIGDGPERGKYEKYLSKNGISNLSLLGNRKDVHIFYAKAQILCMTSLYEGWPMVLAEAMAHECIPVLFDTFESAHDLISNGQSGIIVKPFDCNSMANEINTLLSEDEKIIPMRKAAKEAIVNFTPEKIASIWLNKIKRLLQE